MNLKPLADYVLIKPAAEEAVTKSGIVLPDTMDKKEKIRKGEIIKTGPGKQLESGSVAPMHVREGNLVMYKEDWSAEKIKIEGEEYLIVRESDIIAVIE